MGWRFAHRIWDSGSVGIWLEHLLQGKAGNLRRSTTIRQSGRNNIVGKAISRLTQRYSMQDGVSIH